MIKKKKQKAESATTEKLVTWEALIQAFFQGYGKDAQPEGKKSFSDALSGYLLQEAAKHSCFKNYNTLILFDNTTLIKADSDKIYRAVSSFPDKNKPVLLVLVSPGGELGSAYLIGKLCQEFSAEKFIAVVPRHAKSAATLLCCAADEIHMGSLSELGPIDPQINRMPALGLKNSVEHIADLVSKNPGSSEMFAKYLNLSIAPIQIGYYERVAESAVQYAQRLLVKITGTQKMKPDAIAEKLVYGYKDHGFIIDKEEALEIFGKDKIKSNTAEYDFGSAIYNILSRLEDIADVMDYNFYFVGSLADKPGLTKRKK